MVDQRLGQRGGGMQGGGGPGGMNSGIPPWLQAAYDQLGGGSNYVMTPEDLQMLAYLGMQQQFQLSQGQMGYEQNKLDYDSEYLDFMGEQLGLSREQLAFEFQKYQDEQSLWPQQFQLQQQQLSNDLTLGGYDVEKAQQYALAAQYNTQQAQYGADAAKFAYMESTGQIPVYQSPLDRQRQQYGYASTG